jgi:hypothetical protein
MIHLRLHNLCEFAIWFHARDLIPGQHHRASWNPGRVWDGPNFGAPADFVDCTGLPQTLSPSNSIFKEAVMHSSHQVSKMEPVLRLEDQKCVNSMENSPFIMKLAGNMSLRMRPIDEGPSAKLFGR